MASKRTEQKGSITKIQARRVLERFRNYEALLLAISAAFGIYLLATDKSLWLLAVSHAYGLVGIVTVDVVLGITILASRTNKLFVPAAGWAILTMLLQLGDIATAPQYKMTPVYFAHYLFGLWAYDGLLIAQAIIVYLGLSTRYYEKMVAKKKVLTFFDMGLKNSRRDFLQIGGTIVGMFFLAGILGALTAFYSPPSSQSSQNNNGSGGQTTNNSPGGSIGNINQMKVGSPIYFDYPQSGYPNILIKRSDGTVYAMSMLCTHVCCQCEYVGQSNEIFCPCHGSVFDLNGTVLRGPAPIPLPTVELNVDTSGNIYPVKMNSHSACV
jgi:cytochrome b6-f complex iron-sulfur subunit